MRDDRRLTVLVRASFEASRQRYESPRIHQDLQEQQEAVSRKRVIRLMQANGLEARARKRYKATTMSEHDQPTAANLLDRQFTAAGPNQRWVGDTTEFVIGGSGRLYLAAVLDLFSRFIVGWALSAVNDRHLTLKALDMALKRRCPMIGLLHHSDQGCTYASDAYQAALQTRSIVCSMSRRGNCYDNAVMERFFSTVTSELGEHFESHAWRRWSCSTISRCSTTSGADTRRWGRSVRRRSSDGRAKSAWTPWKTAQTAVSHRAHTRPSSQVLKPKTNAKHVVKPSTESDQAHSAAS